jgi:hypothetical protein
MKNLKKNSNKSSFFLIKVSVNYHQTFIIHGGGLELLPEFTPL